MNPESFDEVSAALAKAKSWYDALRAHFERFCVSAEELASKDSKVKGILVRRGAFFIVLGFLDRSIRVSVLFDRKKSMGILHVEDLSATTATPPQPAVTIDQIPFSATGETEVASGRPGGKLSLGDVADCKLLALRIVYSALDQVPLAAGVTHPASPKDDS